MFVCTAWRLTNVLIEALSNVEEVCIMRKGLCVACRSCVYCEGAKFSFDELCVP